MPRTRFSAASPMADIPTASWCAKRKFSASQTSWSWAAGAAPLLCAGITTYSPLRHWNVGNGQKVGIVGLGGLGHMGVKFAKAFGANVVLFTTSPNKTADALRLGADEVVNSKNPAEFQKHANTFNFILDTVSADHDLNQYLNLLKLDGTMTLVG